MSRHERIVGFERRSVLLFAALAALGTSSAVLAQGTAAKAGDQDIATAFQKADKNGDKALSMDEAKAVPGLAERFKAADTDGDGKISMEEFAAAMKK
jgi:Ca2+-binding EF-hand superfamily protein